MAFAADETVTSPPAVTTPAKVRKMGLHLVRSGAAVFVTLDVVLLDGSNNDIAGSAFTAGPFNFSASGLTLGTATLSQVADWALEQARLQDPTRVPS